jgi:hypothetical protein
MEVSGEVYNPASSLVPLCWRVCEPQRATPDTMQKRKLSCLCQESNPDCLVLWPTDLSQWWPSCPGSWKWASSQGYQYKYWYFTALRTYLNARKVETVWKMLSKSCDVPLWTLHPGMRFIINTQWVQYWNKLLEQGKWGSQKQSIISVEPSLPYCTYDTSCSSFSTACDSEGNMMGTTFTQDFLQQVWANCSLTCQILTY